MIVQNTQAKRALPLAGPIAAGGGRSVVLGPGISGDRYMYDRPTPPPVNRHDGGGGIFDIIGNLLRFVNIFNGNPGCDYPSYPNYPQPCPQPYPNYPQPYYPQPCPPMPCPVDNGGYVYPQPPNYGLIMGRILDGFEQSKRQLDYQSSSMSRGEYRYHERMLWQNTTEQIVRSWASREEKLGALSRVLMSSSMEYRDYAMCVDQVMGNYR